MGVRHKFGHRAVGVADAVPAGSACAPLLRWRGVHLAAARLAAGCLLAGRLWGCGLCDGSLLAGRLGGCGLGGDRLLARSCGDGLVELGAVINQLLPDAFDAGEHMGFNRINRP